MTRELPKVVILHGLLGEGKNWSSLAKKIPRPTQLMDLPNHGSAVHRAEPLTYEAMADSMAAQVPLSADEPCVLLGHSMGGKVAMRMALLFPDSVQALIIVDIAPRRYEPLHTKIFAGLDAISQARVHSRAEADQILQAYEAKKTTRDFLLKNLRCQEDGHYDWKINLPLIRDSYTHILDWPPIDRQFFGPTLFITAGRSSYVREEDQPAITRLFPTAEIHTIMEAGHWVHAQAPEEFLSCLSTFLAQ